MTRLSPTYLTRWQVVDAFKEEYVLAICKGRFSDMEYLNSKGIGTFNLFRIAERCFPNGLGRFKRETHV